VATFREQVKYRLNDRLMEAAGTDFLDGVVLELACAACRGAVNKMSASFQASVLRAVKAHRITKDEAVDFVATIILAAFASAASGAPLPQVDQGRNRCRKCGKFSTLYLCPDCDERGKGARHCLSTSG